MWKQNTCFIKNLNLYMSKEEKKKPSTAVVPMDTMRINQNPINESYYIAVCEDGVWEGENTNK